MKKPIIRKNPPHYGHDDVIWEGTDGLGFISRKDKDRKISLQRCPRCGRENYYKAVLEGICAWCGFNANTNFKILK